jgi:hypothetical protein
MQSVREVDLVHLTRNDRLPTPYLQNDPKIRTGQPQYPRRKNVGSASDTLKQGADDLRLCEAVDFKLRHRRLRLVGRVADAPISVCSDGREEERALYTSAQAARDPRRQTLAASVSHGAFPAKCSMPLIYIYAKIHRRRENLKTILQD